jgi:hypothetical protein
MNSLLSVAVLGFMAVRLATGLRISRSGSGRDLVRDIRSRIAWRHIWPIPLVLTVVIATASGLMRIPGLAWGWWASIGGEGNPVFGTSEATAGGVFEWLIPLAFMAMLLPALPLFAHAEERMFRGGAENWTSAKRCWKTLQFGLVHAIIGIPIGAALALSIGGAYFMAVYLREFKATHSRRQATLESTTAHTAYNGVIIIIVAVAFVLLAVGA